LRSQGLAKVDSSPDTAPQGETVSGCGGISVKRLTLTDFRCYRHQRLDLEAAPVVLTGPNGAGKTNLLEGLSFLVPGRGLRRARLSDVARRDGASAAPRLRPWGVAAVLRTPAGEVEIGTAYEAGAPGGRDKRIVKIDGEIVKSQAALAEHAGALWLTPQMDRLFLEGPGARRRFLDRLVFDSDPAHAGRVNAYDHAMRERTALLRDGGGDAAWLATLEDTLATRGVAVAAARLDVVRRLARHLTGDEAGRRTGAFPGAEITAVGEIESWLADGPALAAEDRFRDRLAAERGRDGAEGRAATGPHRSDLAVRHLGNGQAAALCSTGEQKALLVALVLATARMRAYEQGPAPLLLLDEIAAHLDARRLEVLFDEIIQLGAQVWMTGTDSALFRPLAGRAQFFTVVDATVTH
jgi:DNA replication and repair protein RecF